jgi:hypothetical protein
MVFLMFANLTQAETPVGLSRAPVAALTWADKRDVFPKNFCDPQAIYGRFWPTVLRVSV